MRWRILILAMVAVAVAPCPAPAQQNRSAQPARIITRSPITVRPDAVYDVKKLKIAFSQFAIETGPATIIPIEADWGVTGAVILGPGRFVYRRRNGVTELKGEFHAALLRFPSRQYRQILPVASSVAETDHGAAEMANAIIEKAFNHSYARARQALPVPHGAASATFFSKQHGHLLISDNGKRDAALSLTQDKYLFGFDLDELERQ